jgi:hypothetical protein
MNSIAPLKRRIKKQRRAEALRFCAANTQESAELSV